MVPPPCATWVATLAGVSVYILGMSTEAVRQAKDALADIELVAQLRSAFADAQAIMSHTLAAFGLTEQRYHLLLAVAAGGPAGTGQGALARALHCPDFAHLAAGP